MNQLFIVLLRVLQLVGTIVLMCSVASAAQPTQEQPTTTQTQGSTQPTQKDVQERAKAYSAAVDEAARELAGKRAERLSWLYTVGYTPAKWFSTNLFTRTLWETRLDGESQRAAAMLDFGAHMEVYPVSGLFLRGAIGGHSPIGTVGKTNQWERAKVGFLASALVGWQFPLVGIGVGWAMRITTFSQPAEMGEVRESVTTHYGQVAAQISVRGNAVSVSCDIGTSAAVPGDTPFSALCGLGFSGQVYGW